MRKMMCMALIVAGLGSITSCTPEKTTVLEPQSFTFITTGTWQQQGSANSADVQASFDRVSPEITDNIVNNGAVLAYIRVTDNMPAATEESGNHWASLPYVSTHSTYTYTVNFQYAAGMFRVTRKDSDLVPISLVSYVIKVVLLNPVQKDMLMQSNVNTADYMAVMDLFDAEVK